MTRDPDSDEPYDESECYADEDPQLVVADISSADRLHPNLTEDEYAELLNLTAEFTLDIPYCPWEPNPGPQSAFLLDFGKESLYGGAAGGGKSIALLMAASQFLDINGYAALLLRKSYADLVKPGALMDIAEQWWRPNQDIRYDAQQKTYSFPTADGGTSKIVFGYLQNENDRFNYQGGAYHFIGFDELTQHKQRDYTYLFSRLRRVEDPNNPLTHIPPRMRSTTNPGGSGHEWVYKRFIANWEKWRKKQADRPKRNFHPALISDNPKLDRTDYEESLMELDPITRAQLMRGDWNIRPDGRMFRGSWFKAIHRRDVPPQCVWVRYWDMASTEEDPTKDPDFTAGCLMGLDLASGRLYIADMRHWRLDPADNDRMMRATKDHDTARVTQWMEQEPGSSGKTAIHHYRTQVFTGVSFHGYPSTGDKITRAAPVASMANAGYFFAVIDDWNEPMINELEIFPDKGSEIHDDQVDAISGAYGILMRIKQGALKLGDSQQEFARTTPWRPDVHPVYSPGDLAAGNLTNTSEFLDEYEVAQHASRAFSI